MSFFWNSNKKLRTTVLGSPFIWVNGLFLTIYQFLGSCAAEIHTSLDFHQMVGTLHSSWVITICSGIEFRSIRYQVLLLYNPGITKLWDTVFVKEKYVSLLFLHLSSIGSLFYDWWPFGSWRKTDAFFLIKSLSTEWKIYIMSGDNFSVPWGCCSLSSFIFIGNEKRIPFSS